MTTHAQIIASIHSTRTEVGVEVSPPPKTWREVLGLAVWSLLVAVMPEALYPKFKNWVESHKGSA